MHRTVVVDTVFNFLSIFNVSNVLLISDDSGACLSTTLACKGMHLTRIAKCLVELKILDKNIVLIAQCCLNRIHWLGFKKLIF